MPKARKKRGQAGGFVDKGQRSITQQAIYDVSIPDELVSKASRDLAREAYVTPFLVHEKYGVSLSTARKLLRRLEEMGVLKLYSPSRRSPIYVPARKY